MRRFIRLLTGPYLAGLAALMLFTTIRAIPNGCLVTVNQTLGVFETVMNVIVFSGGIALGIYWTIVHFSKDIKERKVSSNVTER